MVVAIAVVGLGGAAEAADTAPPHIVEVVHTRDATLDIVVDAPIGPTTAVVVSSSLSAERYATTRLRDSGDLVAVIELSAAERRALDADHAVLFRIRPFTFDQVDGSSTIGAAKSFVVSGGELEGLRPDRLLFGFLGVALFGVLWLYRREPDLEHRLRLSGAAGLISVLFLCTTPAMPWTQSDSSGVDHRDVVTRCNLGDESSCAPGAGSAVLEHAEWSAAAIRAGHMSIILLLLPACIWLMVSPRSRGAQALTVAGAGPALFTTLATAIYAATLAPWRIASGGAADLTVLACIALLVVSMTAGLVGRRLRAGEPIPSAILLERWP